MLFLVSCTPNLQKEEFRHTPNHDYHNPKDSVVYLIDHDDYQYDAKTASNLIRGFIKDLSVPAKSGEPISLNLVIGQAEGILNYQNGSSSFQYDRTLDFDTLLPMAVVQSNGNILVSQFEYQGLINRSNAWMLQKTGNLFMPSSNFHILAINARPVEGPSGAIYISMSMVVGVLNPPPPPPPCPNCPVPATFDPCFTVVPFPVPIVYGPPTGCSMENDAVNYFNKIFNSYNETWGCSGIFKSFNDPSYSTVGYFTNINVSELYNPWDFPNPQDDSQNDDIKKYMLCYDNIFTNDIDASCLYQDLYNFHKSGTATAITQVLNQDVNLIQIPDGKFISCIIGWVALPDLYYHTLKVKGGTFTPY